MLTVLRDLRLSLPLFSVLSRLLSEFTFHFPIQLYFYICNINNVTAMSHWTTVAQRDECRWVLKQPVEQKRGVLLVILPQGHLQFILSTSASHCVFCFQSLFLSEK